jgi:signal transduction histidine kinase
VFQNATAKLTMWYLGIVMVISLGFSAVVYHFATNELTYGLNNQTERIFRTFPVFSNNPYLRVRGNDISLGAHHIFLQLVYFNILVLAAAGLLSYLLAKRTLEPIEASHEQQKRFTADVSHELRTPLTSLRMSSEVALMDSSAGKAELRSALESNVEDAGKMELLINNLLRLTKLDGDITSLQVQKLPADELVQSALEQVAKQAAAKHISIGNTASKAVVLGDRESLTQLLVILLDNAIKYSPDTSDVQVSSTLRDGQYELKVVDKGQGIAASALPHVFERFYRADSARTNSSSEGYGLGLSIAKLIADRNDATITLTSRPGKGTTATVHLPLAPAEPTATPNQTK